MAYTIPAFTPGQNGEGYFYRPPFTPRYSIPQSFGEALSYEAQVHWLAGLCQDAERMLATLVSVHCWRSTVGVNTSSFTWNQEFELDGNLVLAPENDWAKPGDIMLLRAPGIAAIASVYNYNDGDGHSGSFQWPLNALGEDLIVARVVKWAPACEKLTLEWHYTVHDTTGYFNAIGNAFATTNAAIAHWAAKINALETRVTNLETRVTNVENRLTTAEQNITNLGNQITELQNSTDADLAALWAAIRNILGNVYGGGTVNDSTGAITWGSGGTIAKGNMNVYSNDSAPTSVSTSGYILTHSGVSNNDIWAS